jgi:surface protein
MLLDCNELYALRLNNCNKDTINKIINSSDFPIGRMDCVTRKIYCRSENASGLTAPEGWVFSYNINEETAEPSLPKVYEPYEYNNDELIAKAVTIVNESHTDLIGMFYNCYNLRSIDTQYWNTINVTDMSHMFENCIKLTQLDSTKINTSNVTNMYRMFWNCHNLTSLNVNNFNTNKVFNMSQMFTSCSRLTELDLSNWDTSNVTNMYMMFSDCSNLRKLNLSNFNIGNSVGTREMLHNCDSLIELRLDNCNNTTISEIINSYWFTTNAIAGGRRIYCKKTNATGLTPPTNWEFVYIDE